MKQLNSKRTVQCAFRWIGLSFSLFLAPALWAQIAGNVDPAFNPDVTGQYVLATAAQPDGKILIGGVFTSVGGEPRNLIARLLPDGTLESTNTFNPQIDAGGFAVSGIIVQSDGKILIAGNFSHVNGQARGHLARLHSDGTLENTATFNSGTGANDTINGIALQADGKILIGGFFRSFNGQPRNAIARLNADGGLESIATFNPGSGVGGEVPLVRSIAIQRDGKIVLGGYFTSVGGEPRTNLARLNGNGTVERAFPFSPAIVDGFGVDSVAVQADGRILVGGTFGNVNEAPRYKLARLLPDGSLEDTNTFNPGLGGGVDGVYSMAFQADGKMLIAGDFTTVNDEPRNRFARLDPSGMVESANVFDAVPGGDVPLVFAVAQQTDGKILLGGFFTTVNEQPRNRFARLVNDAASQSLVIPAHQQLLWLRSGATPEVEQVTFELTTDDGANWSLLGPGTRTFGGWQCDGLSLVPGGLVRARGRTVGGSANASSGLIEQIVPLEFVPEIVVGSTFDHSLTNGSTQSLGAASVGGNTSLNFTVRNIGNVNLLGVAATITGPDRDMFTLATEPAPFVGPLGGYTGFTVKFSPTSLGLKSATLRIASDDADENPFVVVLTAGAQNAPVAGSVDLAFAPELISGYVQATALQPDGKIIIGGNFTIADGQPPMNVVRLNLDGTLESTNTFNPGWGPGGDVRCAAVQADGKILIGGMFGLKRLNTDGTIESASTFNPGTGPNNQVIALAVRPDGKILLAGYFTAVDGEPRGGIARLNADGTLESTATFNPGSGADLGVLGVGLQPDGKIVIGGDFTSVNGLPRNGIARLHSDGALESTATFNPGSGAGGDGPSVFCVTVQPNGKILLGGYFTRMNGQPRNRIARLNADGTVESAATFNPGIGANEVVNGMTLQADGKILLAGYFTTMNDLPRSGFVRLLPDGTVESTHTFNPGTGVNGAASGATLQPDGRILLVGNLITVNEQPSTPIKRLLNDPAIQSLTISNQTRISWTRGGSAPEVEQVTFEVSTDEGTNWILAGLASRIADGWECTDLNLPIGGHVRARGRTVGATFSGSSSLIEQTIAFDFGPRARQQSILADLIAWRVTVTNRADGRKLDLAIKHLTRSLAANIWVDGAHLNLKLGPRAFHEAKLTAWILCRLMKSTKSQLSDTVVQGFIDRLFEAERALATGAIDDAISAGASSKSIAQAKNYLSRGDARAAAGKCNRGNLDFSLAWRHAARAKVP